MNIKYLALALLIVSIFTFTQITPTLASSPLDTINAQLQSLLGQLTKLVTQKSDMAATVTTAVVPVTPDVTTSRHCDVNLVTWIYGKEVSVTKTVYGSPADRFAIGLQMGASLPFTQQIHTASNVGVGYFTPTDYLKNKTYLDSLTGNTRYKIMSAVLANTNSKESGHTFNSATHPYVEARVVNSAISGIGAGNVAILANVTNCVGEVVPPKPVLSSCADTLVAGAGTLCAIQPSKTDARIKDISPDKGQEKDGFGYHVLGIPKSSSAVKGVWINFSGSGGRGYNQQTDTYGDELWFNELMEQGYVVISLAYDNSSSVNGGLCGPDTKGNTRDNCAGEVREIALTGKGTSPFRTTDTYNTIDYRLKALLVYLKNNTEIKLPGDIDPNNIDWSQISLSGHSQGAAQSYYIAKQRKVANVCLLSGSYDYPDTINPGSLAIADWFTTGPNMTPTSRIGALITTTDERYENFVFGLTKVIGLPSSQVIVAKEKKYYDENGHEIVGHNATFKSPSLKDERAAACFRKITTPPPPPPPSKKPNIVFVLTDDLNVELLSQLPKLKTLMTDKGMTFSNHLVSLSLCCPSRTTALLGQYGHNTGVLTNDALNADGTLGAFAAFQKYDGSSKSIAVWLKNAGYKTALMGKYLNGYHIKAPGMSYDVPEGWSEWAVPLDGDPYSQYNYTLNTNGKKEEHYLANCVHTVGSKNCKLNLKTATVSDKNANYMINVLGTKAQDFITRSANEKTPFFLYLAPYTPHSPSTPAPKYESLLTDSAWLAKHPLPKNAAFDEADISDKPSWLRDNGGFLAGKNLTWLELAYQKRVASMYGIEDMLSNLIDTLTKTGQLENTYIVFTSDNGYHLGEHRLTGGKLTEFDTDLRIPLIIRGPKVAPGSVATSLTANVDIAPTFASLAGVTIPSAVDGRSFKETLLGGKSSERNALLIEHADPADKLIITKLQYSTDEPRDTQTQDGPISGGEFVTKYSGVRTPVYTYVHYVKNDEEELYDNIKDPFQLYNIASKVNPDLLARLRTWTKDLSTCKGASCRAIESERRVMFEDSNRCVVGDVVVLPGHTITAYSSSVAPAGGSCTAISQKRTCTLGVLTGDATYSSPTCSADAVSDAELLSPKGEDTSIISLADGSLLMMRAAEKEVKPAFRGGRLWMLKSTDSGKTWKKLTGSEAIPYVASSTVAYAINGPAMKLMKSGRILAVYHLWTNYIPQKYSTHSVKMIFSDDGGVTWKPMSTVDTIKVPNGTLGFGLWEPFILTPKSRPGVVQVYYAAERDDSVSCPSDPNHPSGVKKGQDIAMKESTDYGKTWGNTRIVLRNGKSREGVPTIAESPDGALFLAHEHLRFPLCTDTRPQSGFLPSIAISKDGGLTWVDKGPAYYPPGNFLGSGWPHMIRLTDGRLGLRFATETVAGEDSPRKVNLLLTTNIPSMTTEPIWEKTPTVIMGNDLQWGTLFQTKNNDFIVTGGQLNMLQYYRVFPLSTLPPIGQ